MKTLPRRALALLCLSPLAAQAQTPTALAEWQFSAGQALMPRFVEEIPQWQRVVGAGVVALPRFEGARAYTVMPALNLELRYRDRAFASTAEGLGVNLFSSRNYRAGIAAGFDLGRDETDNPVLRGLGDIKPAPVAKAFGELVLFPVVLRGVVRHNLGGGGGSDADLSAYMPLAGSKKFFVFAGPSVTWSDGRSMQQAFGISPQQAAAGSRQAFDTSGGLRSASFGTSATLFMGESWFVNATGAYQRLLGDAEDSPISRSNEQGALSVMLGRQW